MENISYKLSHYSLHGGCSCKIDSSFLKEILINNEALLGSYNLLVGNNMNDDGAVYDLGNGKALISTADFFTPVVDDAFDYGRISAANAISDIYAMGGTPLMAIALLGWPVDKLPAHVAQKVVAGAHSICDKAGIALAGGHSIVSTEPIFGLAVTGQAEKENIKQNHTAREGDLLFITKPLGTGIISAAAKREKVIKEDLEKAISVMSELNNAGTALGSLKAVTAMTDITGFGFAGHLLEMTSGGMSAEIFFDALPVMNNVDFYIEQNIFPEMTTKNFSAYGKNISELTARQLLILFDPQTSGGLLVAVKPDMVNEYLEVISMYNLNEISSAPVGKFTAKGKVWISIT